MNYYDEKQLRRLKRKRQAARLFDILQNYKHRRHSYLSDVPLPRSQGNKNNKDLLDGLGPSYHDLKFEEDYDNVLYFLMRFVESIFNKGENLQLDDLCEAIRNHFRLENAFRVLERDIVKSAVDVCRYQVNERVVKKLPDGTTGLEFINFLKKNFQETGSVFYDYSSPAKLDVENTKLDIKAFNNYEDKSKKNLNLFSEAVKGFYTKSLIEQKQSFEGVVDVVIKMLIASQIRKNSVDDGTKPPSRFTLNRLEKLLKLDLEKLDYQSIRQMKQITNMVTDSKNPEGNPDKVLDLRNRVSHEFHIVEEDFKNFKSTLLDSTNKNYKIYEEIVKRNYRNPEENYNAEQHLLITIPHKTSNLDNYSDLLQNTDGQKIGSLLRRLGSKECNTFVKSLLKKNLSLKKHFLNGFLQSFDKKLNIENGTKKGSINEPARQEVKLIKVTNEQHLKKLIASSKKLLLFFYIGSIPVVENYKLFKFDEKKKNIKTTLKSAKKKLILEYPNESYNLAYLHLSNKKKSFQELNNLLEGKGEDRNGIAFYENGNEIFKEKLSKWTGLNDASRIVSYFKREVVFPITVNENDEQQVQALKMKLRFTYQVVLVRIEELMGNQKTFNEKTKKLEERENFMNFIRNNFDLDYDEKKGKEILSKTSTAFSQSSKIRVYGTKSGNMESTARNNVSYGLEVLNDLLDVFGFLSEQKLTATGKKNNIKDKLLKIRQSVIAFWSMKTTNLNFYALRPDHKTENTSIVVDQLKLLTNLKDDDEKSKKVKDLIFKYGVKAGHDAASKHLSEKPNVETSVEVMEQKVDLNGRERKTKLTWRNQPLAKSPFFKQKYSGDISYISQYNNDNYKQSWRNKGKTSTDYNSNNNPSRFNRNSQYNNNNNNYNQSWRNKGKTSTDYNSSFNPQQHINRNSQYGNRPQYNNKFRNIFRDSYVNEENYGDSSSNYHDRFNGNNKNNNQDTDSDGWTTVKNKNNQSNKGNHNYNKRGRNNKNPPGRRGIAQNSRKRKASDLYGNSAKKSKLDAIERKIAKYEQKIRRLDELIQVVTDRN